MSQKRRDKYRKKDAINEHMIRFLEAVENDRFRLQNCHLRGMRYGKQIKNLDLGVCRVLSKRVCDRGEFFIFSKLYTRRCKLYTLYTLNIRL